MVVFPNAKINIGLDITERRPDGYHNLRTVMVPLPELNDVLEIVPTGASAGSVALRISGRGCSCDAEDNLVVKAYRSYEGLPGVEIRLYKAIPDGAGLGGGSADCAFALKALNELFELGESEAELAERAGRLGADCPFFVKNRPALATETGTRLESVEISGLERLEAIVAKPRAVYVSTREAYSGVHPGAVRAGAAHELPKEQWREKLKNDFEGSVFGVAPRVGEVKTALLLLPGAVYAQMSGSGSAVYALFEREDTPDIERVRALLPDCDVYRSRLTN